MSGNLVEDTYDTVSVKITSPASLLDLSQSGQTLEAGLRNLQEVRERLLDLIVNSF